VLEGHEKEAAGFILQDFFHIFGGLDPWRGKLPGATENVKDGRKIVREEPAGNGRETLVCEYWGPDLHVMNKKYLKENGRIDWQSWYFRYIVKDTLVFPDIIVYDNHEHGYRLILTVSDLYEDNQP